MRPVLTVMHRLCNVRPTPGLRPRPRHPSATPWASPGGWATPLGPMLCPQPVAPATYPAGPSLPRPRATAATASLRDLGRPLGLRTTTCGAPSASPPSYQGPALLARVPRATQPRCTTAPPQWHRDAGLPARLAGPQACSRQVRAPRPLPSGPGAPLRVRHLSPLSRQPETQGLALQGTHAEAGKDGTQTFRLSCFTKSQRTPRFLTASERTERSPT